MSDHSGLQLPQAQWNEQYQRYTVWQWDHSYQRYYLMHQVDGQWVFLQWGPDTHVAQIAQNRVRVDSANDPGLERRPGREGVAIYGTYSTADPNPSEPLDPSYFVRDKNYFQPGTVFSLLFTEAAGTTVTAYNDSYEMVKYGEYAYSQIRRFVVVRQKKAFCFALPIFTYGGQGTLKRGVDPEDHAIAYSYGQSPQILNGEHPGLLDGSLGKPPICIVMQQPDSPLTTASRIYFGIHHPIQYNVKVKDIGYVHPDFVKTLHESWTRQLEDLMDYPEDSANTTAQPNKAGSFAIEEAASSPSKAGSFVEEEAAPLSNKLDSSAEREPAPLARTQGLKPGFQTVINPRSFFKKGRVFSTPITESTGEILTRFFAVVKPQATRSICLEIKAFDTQSLPEDYARVRLVEDASIDPVSDVQDPDRTVYLKIESADTEISAFLGIAFTATEISHNIKVHNLGRVFGNSIGIMEHNFREKNPEYIDSAAVLIT